MQAALPVVVPCRTGCSACCRGPFDISAADARLVSAAIAILPGPVAADIRQRARAQLDAGRQVVASWQGPWRVSELDEDGFDRMCDALEQEPCPALDPESGACRIHEHRPATCRLMGLSLRTPEGDLLDNPCPIQDRFPGYGQLPAHPFDLMEFEVDAAREDLEAMAEGWHSTTIAGAVVRET